MLLEIAVQVAVVDCWAVACFKVATECAAWGCFLSLPVVATAEEHPVAMIHAVAAMQHPPLWQRQPRVRWDVANLDVDKAECFAQVAEDLVEVDWLAVILMVDKCLTPPLHHTVEWAEQLQHQLTPTLITQLVVRVIS